MGFHTRHLPDLEDLKKMHAKMTDDEFLRKMTTKADAFVGPSDSFRYIEEVQKKIHRISEKDK